MAKQTKHAGNVSHPNTSTPSRNQGTPLNQANLRTRKATISDIPFLAIIEYEASLPPSNHCFWDDVLHGTGTDALQFIEAMLRADASNWGNVDDFLVLEEAGQPVAAAAGFEPSLEDYRPLRLSRLEATAQLLGWSKETVLAFRDRYEVAFGPDRHLVCLQPQASWIIETVAVVPEARGRGLGKVLLGALLDKGRSQQHTHAGIMVFNGNDIAQHTYESIGFKPYQAFFAEYFDEKTPGITKLRLRLN